MAYAPKPPYPKAAGNPIRSVDWNELVDETKRLETAKLNQTGGAVSGSLTVGQNLTVNGTSTLIGNAELRGALDVTNTTNLRASVTVGGAIAVAGTSSFTGAATFGSVRMGPGSGAPQDNLEVKGNARFGANPVRVTSAFSNFPNATNAEICNDITQYKTLMLVGNSSSGARKVSVWDRLEVWGPSCATSFCNISDRRLKTGIVAITDALERVSRLRGVSFRWRTDQPDTSPAATAPAGPQLGVVAQEVAEVFPELVSSTGPDDQHLGVDYSGLTAVLLEAVKELKADNERLRQRVDALEGVVSSASSVDAA
ncbi:tail fiber domain-containing protein [Actinopolymorpha pittospori]